LTNRKLNVVRIKNQHILLITLIVIIWGSAYPLTRIVAFYFSPFIIAEGRVLIGFLVIYTIARNVKMGLKEAIAGILNLLFPVACLNLGVILSENPGLVATFIYTQPIFAVVFSYVLLQERLKSLQIIGTFIGFIGVLIAAGSTSFDLGSLVSIAGGFTWAVGTVFFKKYLQNEDLLLVYSSMSLFAFLFFIPLTVINFYYTINLYAIGLLVLLAVSAQGIGFLLWFLLIKTTGVAKASTTVLLVPACSYCVSYLLLATVPTISNVVGSALVLFGVLLSYFDNINPQRILIK